MTTDDRDTIGAALTLDEGPIHEALAAIDLARAAIEQAKTEVRERRDAFARAFQAELDARSGGGGGKDRTELLGPVVAELYWEHPELRVSDIVAATGLSGEQVRRIAGPTRREVPCRRCGTPTEVLQTRRTRPPDGLCADCRPVAGFGEVEPLGFGPLPPPPDEPPELDAAPASSDGPAIRSESPGQWYHSW